MEIPGFYFVRYINQDPIKQKYFRDTPELRRQRAKLSRTEEQFTNIHSSMYRYVYNKEVGNKSRLFLNWQKSKSIHVHDSAIVSDYSIHKNSGFFGFKSGEFVVAGLDWDQGRMTFAKTFANNPSPVTSVSLSKEFVFVSFLGHGFQSGHVDMYSYLNGIDTLFLVKELNPGSQAPVWSCSPSSNGSKLAMGSSNHFYVYNLETLQKTKIRIKGDVFVQAWKDEMVWNGSRNGTVSLYDLFTSKSCLYINTNSPVSYIHSTETRFMTCSINGSIQLWDTRNPKEPLAMQKVENEIEPIKGAIVGEDFVFASDRGWIYALDMVNWNIRWKKKWGDGGGCLVKSNESGSFYTSHHGICDLWSIL